MNEKEIKKQASDMKKAVNKVIKTKEDAIKFLASTGVYTKKGNLRKRFKRISLLHKLGFHNKEIHCENIITENGHTLTIIFWDCKCGASKVECIYFSK